MPRSSHAKDDGLETPLTSLEIAEEVVQHEVMIPTNDMTPDSAMVYRGGFQCHHSAVQKARGRPFMAAEGVDFMTFMEEAEVFVAGFSGSSFTWCNNR